LPGDPHGPNPPSDGWSFNDGQAGVALARWRQDYHRHARQGPYLSVRASHSSARRTEPAGAQSPGPLTARPLPCHPASAFSTTAKILLFVSTCSEKTEVANRISLELGNLQRRRRRCGSSMPVSAMAPCCPRVMRAVHGALPDHALYVVAKEISYEDVRLMRRRWRIACSSIRHCARRHQSLLCRGTVADAALATAAQA